MQIIQNNEFLVKNPIISVMCITYNQVDYISKALDSFLLQDLKVPYEIIVNDDCSTDGTTEILLNYQKQNPQVMRVLLHERNQYSLGKSAMGEFVIPEVRGKYGAMCEGDDYWTDSQKLSQQLSFMESNPTFAACVHASENVQAESGRRLSTMRYSNCDCDVLIRDALSNTQCYSTNSLFITATALRAYRDSSLFPLKCDGDQKMMTFFALNGGIHYINKIMSAYRFMAKNSTNRSLFLNDDHMSLAARKRDLRIELLKKVDEMTDGEYRTEIENGIDRMDYLFYKDIRDARTLKKRWPDMFGRESLPAKVDMALYTFCRPIHKLIFHTYFK